MGKTIFDNKNKTCLLGCKHKKGTFHGEKRTNLKMNGYLFGLSTSRCPINIPCTMISKGLILKNHNTISRKGVIP